MAASRSDRVTFRSLYVKLRHYLEILPRPFYVRIWPGCRIHLKQSFKESNRIHDESVYPKESAAALFRFIPVSTRIRFGASGRSRGSHPY